VIPPTICNACLINIYNHCSTFGNCVNLEKNREKWGFLGGVLQPTDELGGSLSMAKHRNTAQR